MVRAYTTGIRQRGPYEISFLKPSKHSPLFLLLEKAWLRGCAFFMGAPPAGRTPGKESAGNKKHGAQAVENFYFLCDLVHDIIQ